MSISLLCESCNILEHGDFQRLNCNASFLMVHFFEVSSLLFYLPSSVEMTFPQCSPQTHSQSVLLYVLYFYNPSPFDFFFSYPTFKNVPFIFFSHVSVVFHTFFHELFPFFPPVLSVHIFNLFFLLSVPFFPFLFLFLRCCRKVLH